MEDRNSLTDGNCHYFARQTGLAEKGDVYSVCIVWTRTLYIVLRIVIVRMRCVLSLCACSDVTCKVMLPCASSVVSLD